MTDPNKKISMKPQAYQWLRFGEIKPTGWMHAQMTRDLEHGFVGHLDELVPDLIQHDDVYGADRLTKAAKTKELGVVAKETQWEVQFLWWNSETQSNWLDGMVRTALLLDHPVYLEKARTHIERLLTTQDPDGYLGIYAPDLRFNFTSENGELWAQASLFRVLLGWYESTWDERALEGVRRAVNVTMRAYPIGQAHPFDVKDDFAGVGHGLVFTDILDRLYQLTNDQQYLVYARWLYEEYSRQPLSQGDIQIANLLHPDYRFKAHGVHTYEQLRSLLTVVYSADDPQLDAALAAALAKLEICLTPSGGPIGDEFIRGRQADAGETGYEYCSIHELLDTYTQLLQKTSEMKWADRAEWLFFNAAQGARHPSQSAIAYLKTDNSFSMTGPLHPDDPQGLSNPQIRYKYSPVHQDVAVCCVPNAGRIAPYYIKAAWLRSPDGLVAALYGACELQTEINGVALKISEVTNYPFDLKIIFKVEVSQPVEFTLNLRKPAWASGFSLTLNNPTWEKGDRLRNGGSLFEDGELLPIRRAWSTGDQVTVRFEAEVKIQPWGADESFISHGPLLFALPLEAEAYPGREYRPGFQDCYYNLAASAAGELALPPDPSFSLIRKPFNPLYPWDSLNMSGSLPDPSKGQPQPVRLIPFGGSILRRVTFGKSPNQ